MDAPQWTARRATLDDLPALQALWQRCGLPWEQLERYLTEFQVVAGEDGAAVATLGLLVEGSDALVHTEAIPPGTVDSDELRAALWRRVKIVARNQGVARVWTQEDAPYWGANGFGVPDAKVFVEAKAKARFLGQDPDWRMCQLTDPEGAAKRVQEQLAIWDAMRTQESDEFQQKIRTIRSSAFLITGVILTILVGMALYVFLRRPDIMQHLIRR